MNTDETKMIEILKDLRKNCFAKALKLEFEAEGTSFEEALVLKEMAQKSGLELTVKIGGCEAVRDVIDTKKLEAQTVIAPMIESEYALKKFISAVKNIYENVNDIRLFINIETVTALENFDKIINSKNFRYINGIIFGRGDMSCSMGMQRNSVNAPAIFVIAKVLSNKMKNCDKEFIAGGNVTLESLQFFKDLPYISGFETRKIVFDKDILNSKNADNGIIKAIDFEIEWLKYKQKIFGIEDKQTLKRLEFFEKNIKKL